MVGKANLWKFHKMRTTFNTATTSIDLPKGVRAALGEGFGS